MKDSCTIARPTVSTTALDVYGACSFTMSWQEQCFQQQAAVDDRCSKDRVHVVLRSVWPFSVDVLRNVALHPTFTIEL